MMSFFKIFNQWTDIEYLEGFFTANKNDLYRPYWNGITIEQAIIKTRNEAIEFQKYLKKLSKTKRTHRIVKFTTFFKPLEKQFYYSGNQNKKKAYGRRSPSWLRLYALQLGEDMYI